MEDKINSKLLSICSDKFTFTFFRIYSRGFFRTYTKDENKSDSENTSYVSAVKEILGSEKKFSKFRRSFKYMPILEHLSYRDGLDYFKLLKSRNCDFEELAKLAVKNDSVGKPRVFNYAPSFESSPTTLRYLKVSSDLKLLFDSKFDSVVEIGAGYGGQASILLQNGLISNYYIFDLPPVQALITKFIKCIDTRGSVQMVDLSHDFDEISLVISNYAFSELPRKIQTQYCRRVLSKSKMGYLTMNTGLTDKSGRSFGKMTLGEIQKFLPSSEILREEPLTGPDNYILIWGHKKTNLLFFNYEHR